MKTDTLNALFNILWGFRPAVSMPDWQKACWIREGWDVDKLKSTRQSVQKAKLGLCQIAVEVFFPPLIHSDMLRWAEGQSVQWWPEVTDRKFNVDTLEFILYRYYQTGSI